MLLLLEERLSLHPTSIYRMTAGNSELMLPSATGVSFLFIYFGLKKKFGKFQKDSLAKPLQRVSSQQRDILWDLCLGTCKMAQLAEALDVKSEFYLWYPHDRKEPGPCRLSSDLHMAHKYPNSTIRKCIIFRSEILIFKVAYNKGKC